MWFALAVILAYGLWLQWPGMGNTILERLHGWRECQTAMTSRNFVRDGMNPLFARVDYMGDGQMQLELPILNCQRTCRKRQESVWTACQCVW